MGKKILKNEDELMPFDINKWHNSKEVKALEPEVKHVWFEMICCMWQSEERGYLTTNYQPIVIFTPSVQTGVRTGVPTLAIAGVIPCVEPLLKEAIVKMYSLNVFSVREDGVIYCRDMVREVAYKSQKSKAGKASYEKRQSVFNNSVQTGVRTPVQTHTITDVQTPVQTSAIPGVQLPFRARTNTTTTISNISLDNKGKEEDNTLIINNGGINGVRTPVRTPVRTEIIDGYAGEVYNISKPLETTPHPLSVCLWNYFNNKLYEQTRGLHIIRLKLSDDIGAANEILERWAKAFNRCQISGGVTEMVMAGTGNSTWVKYLPNWINTVIGDKKNINPDVLYTSEHDDNHNIKSQKSDKKNTKRKLPGADATPEEWNAYYDGK